MVEVVFIGTGSSVPSKQRSLPCVAVKRESGICIFDCGEGTQRQFMISPLSFMKIDAIFITHMHGDHMLGLPGLLQTMSMSGRKRNIFVAGPKGFSKSLKLILSVCEGGLIFETEIVDADDGDVFTFDGYTVKAFSVDHNVPALGYVYQEKDRPGKFDKESALRFGLKPGPDFTKIQNGETVNGINAKDIVGPKRRGSKIVYTGDTRPCDNIVINSEGSDLLIHEANYIEGDEELARQHFHSTVSDAIATADRSGSSRLALVHLSNRYDDIEKIENDAKKKFSKLFIPNDMNRIVLK